MRTTYTLASILSRRLDQPGAFEVHATVVGGGYYQQPIKAIHQDCFEYSNGTLVAFQHIKVLRIVED